MFNFKNFLELNKYHKNWKKLFNDTYKKEFKYNRTGKKEDYKDCLLADENLAKYNELYAEEIFRVLKDKKPLLHNYIDGKYEKWDDVVKKYNSMPLDWVIPLVEENGGRYRLPAKYYVQKNKIMI